jgi:hypothetical protein
MPFTPSQRFDLNIAAYESSSVSALTLLQKLTSTSLELLCPSAFPVWKALFVH